MSKRTQPNIEIESHQRTFVTLALMVTVVYLVWGRVLPPSDLVPGDIGDSRFNLYVLEHGYRWMIGSGSLWDMDIFWPIKGAGAFSDMHLGSLIFYAFPRILGLDMYVSMQVWFMVGLYGTLFSAYFAARWLSFSVMGSGIAAFVFTCALPVTAQISRVQFVHRWAIPWAVVAVISTSRQLIARRNNIVMLVVAVCIQFVISPGSAVASIFVCSILWGVLIVINPPMDNFPVVRIKPFGAAAALSAIVFTGYVASNYSHFKTIYGIKRETYETLLFSPGPKALFLADHSVLWQGLSYRHSAFDIGRHEVQLFVGLGLATFVLIGVFRASRLKTLEIALFTVSLLTFLGIMKIGGWSAFTRIQIIPGFDSVRTPGRFILVLLFPIGLIAGSGFRSLVTSKSATLKSMACSLLVFMCVEYSATDLKAVTKTELITRTENLISRIDTKIKTLNGEHVDAFLVLDDNEQSSAVQNFESMKDLDAMLASLELGIPTLNGYSGFLPFGRYRVANCDDVSKLFAEILEIEPETNLSRIALIGGECG